MDPQISPDAASQAFLDAALDRVLRAWSDGTELSLGTLVQERPDLRHELAELIELARESAVLRPPILPSVPGYQVLHEVGRGGMGVVYAARQLGLERLVALKVLPHADSVQARRRFLSEAKSLARVQHPHVVGIFDVIESDDTCAYAMEWIDGKNLADLLNELRHWSRRGEPPAVAFGGDASSHLPRDAIIWFCRLGSAIARALAAMHKRGLVHRDVKPSNILLRADGSPLLSDFGLVRDEGTHLTRSGQIVGTIAFAPPEQLSGGGEKIGPTADVFALGATMHWALAGSAPFAGMSSHDLCVSIAAGARRPLTAIGLSKDLDTIVGKCLEARPEDRYASANELAEDLDRLLALRPICARPLGIVPRLVRFTRRNRRVVLAALGAAITVTVCALLLVLQVLHRQRVSLDFEKHLRAAHRALLDPFFVERVARDRLLPPLPPAQTDRRIGEALLHYDEAIALMPRPDILRQREVVLLARERIRSIAKHARSELGGTLAPPLLPSELRADAKLHGLYAFLLDDVAACKEAWKHYDLTPAEADPLIDVALGQMQMAADEPGHAWPRLQRAFDAWPDEAFLAASIAHCAVRVRDLVAAERFLLLAERLGEPQDGPVAVVWAELRVAQGRREDARLAYARVIWHHTFARQGSARLRYADFLAGDGDPWSALEILMDPIEHLSESALFREHVPHLAQEWWSSLRLSQQVDEICRAWSNGPWSRLGRIAAAHPRVGECAGSSTALRDSASGSDHRPTWSMSTVPMELTVMSVTARCIRYVPLPLQRLVAHAALTMRITRGGASTAGGIVSALAALGCVISSLSSEVRGQMHWVPRSLSLAPSARTWARGAFDPASGMVLVYGGHTAPNVHHDDMWAWNGSQGTWHWLTNSSGLSSRYACAVSADVAGSMLMFGGYVHATATHVADTWRWTGSAWVQLTPSQSPPAREGAAMALDPQRGVVVLFGGVASAIPFNDTWEWDGGNWTQVVPQTAPVARWAHTMAYDQVRHRVLLFGGMDFSSHFNDMYEWDGGMWTARQPIAAPPPLQGAQLVWDGARSRATLFGGYSPPTASQPNGVFSNEVWDWDGTEWMLRTGAGSQVPTGRQNALFVYDPIRRQTLMFGGDAPNNTALGDTCVLEPLVPARVTTTGAGCGGVLGTPSVAAASGTLPWINSVLTIDVDNVPGFTPVPILPVLVAGFSNPAAGGLFCRADCTLRTSADAAYLLSPIGNHATWSLVVPNNAALLGTSLFAQAVSFNFAQFCTDAMSNGIQVTVGGR